MPVAAKHAAPSKTGPKRKRARGRARTDVSSSESSDSSSSDSSDNDSDAEVPSGDIEMADADSLSSDESADEDEGEEKKTANARQQTKRLPSPLRDLHDPRPFEEYYMKLVTSEFGDDLDAVRKAKDFEEGGVRSLGVLVRALESGVNVFDEDEMRSVVVAGK